MEFSRQEYWSGLLFPSPGDLPDPGIKPGSPVLQADAFTIWASRDAPNNTQKVVNLKQFSHSVVCNSLQPPMDCSTSGFPVHHQLLELAQTQVHWVGDAIQPSHPVVPVSSQSFPALGSFPVSQFFASGDHTSIGVSASASVFQWIFRTDFL